MQSSQAVSIGLPVVLCIIMLGLGLSLQIDDFRRVLREPRAALVGLVCQIGILPVICFFLALYFGLPPAIAVGRLPREETAKPTKAPVAAISREAMTRMGS